MDSSLLTRMQQLIILIIESSNNTYSDEHQKSIYELMLFEKNEIAHIELLLHMLCNSQNIIFTLPSNTHQFHLFIYIKNFLARYDNRKEIIKLPSIEQLITTSLSIYFNDSLTNEIRRTYEVILDSFITIAHNFPNPKAYYETFFHALILELKNDFRKDITHNRIMNYSYFLQKLVKRYQIFFNKQSEMILYIELYALLFDKIESMIHTLNDSEKKKIYNCFLLNFSHVVLYCTDSFQKNEISIYKYDKVNNDKEDCMTPFFETELFCSMIKRCLSIGGSVNLIVFYNEEGKLLLKISKTKGVFIELLSIICNKLHKMNMIEQYPNYKQMIVIFIKGLIHQLGSLYKKAEYPREKGDNSKEEIIQLSNVVKILKFLEEVCGSIYGNDIFIENSNEIFQYIIVPNLLPSPLLLTLFTFDENEFVKMIHDLSHCCEEKLPQQKVLRLLSAMCLHIDGFFKYIITIELDILDKLVGISHNNNTSEDEVYLYLIKNIPQEHLFDQAFQIMISLSFLFHENEAVLSLVEDRIDCINHILIKTTNDYLKAKLCLFYSRTLHLLFNDGKQILTQSFDDALLFLYQCITSTTTTNKTNKSLILTALNSLNDIIFNKHLKTFCTTFVKLYSKQIIYYLHSKEELKGLIQTGEFDTLLKGIIKYYLIDIDKESVDIFNYFWKDFIISLNKTLDNSIIRIPLKDRKDLQCLSNNINLLKRFTAIAKSKNTEIKEAIYTPILSLLNQITKIFNQDFEQEILELISVIIEEIKFVPFDYGNILIEYFKELNAGCDGVFYHKIEGYHTTFIFDFLKNMHYEQIKDFKYKDILIDIFSDRLFSIPRRTMVETIYLNHYVYIEMITIFILFFFNCITNEDITALIQLLYKRMNTIPNSNYDLNVKLLINIFLLVNITNDYSVIKCVNMKQFIGKVVHFFPLKDCSIIEHEQISQFCSSIVHLILLELSNSNSNNDSDYEKLLHYLIALNYEELKIIKEKSIKILNNSELNSSRSNSDVEIESHGVIFKLSARKHKIKSTPDKSLSFSDEDDENKCKVLHLDNKNKENDENDYSNQSVNENDEDDNEDDNSIICNRENTYRFNDLYNDDCIDYDDDKDTDFLHVKKSNNFFSNAFTKYSNEYLKLQSSQINVFKLYDMMLTELQSNFPQLYNRIMLNFKDKQSQFIRECQKIAMNGGYVYRKIIKVKKSK